MKNKKSSNNSTYEESDDSSSSSDSRVRSKKSPAKKGKQNLNLARITELEKQLQLLKEETSQNEPMPTKKSAGSSEKKTVRKRKLIRLEEVTDWSSSDPEQPIPKHKGNNYYDIPRLLHIKKRTWNGYVEAMRHLCKEHLAEVANTKMYKDIDAGLLNKVVDKFNKKNDRFPKTIGDWAPREMIRRYVNNCRENRRNLTRSKNAPGPDLPASIGEDINTMEEATTQGKEATTRGKEKQKNAPSPDLPTSIGEDIINTTYSSTRKQSTSLLNFPEPLEQDECGSSDILPEYANAYLKRRRTNEKQPLILDHEKNETNLNMVETTEFVSPQIRNLGLDEGRLILNDICKIASANDEQVDKTSNTNKKSVATRRSTRKRSIQPNGKSQKKTKNK